jgi:hypothetical protein
MANIPILISGIDENGDLILPNNGITHVDRGDTVTWVLGPRSGVKRINQIVKNNGVEVFSEKPSKIPFSRKWVGKISPNVEYGSEQKYDIHFTREASLTIEVFDPKIIVNSR